MGPALLRRLGRVEYADALQRMLAFNAARSTDTPDEIWFLEHPPVFTRGVSCRLEPHRNPAAVPVVDTDRGGQITYHGPGQLIGYLLFDVKRTRQGIRRFVYRIEQALIDTLAGFGVDAVRREGAPGVYVDVRKIAALGLRVRNGFTYHGLSLNLDMDLEPFSWIDPCGYAGLETVNLAELVPGFARDRVEEALAGHLATLATLAEAEAPPEALARRA